jgi:predicted MFS family arabinose efflux permease
MPEMRDVLAQRDVRLLLMAGLISQTGDWVLRTGIAYEVYALTGSTLASATVLLASLAPQVVVGSVAGVYVDRWDRRRVMIIVNLLLGLVLVPLLLAKSGDQVPIIYLVVAASSCLSPFFLAAEATMLPALVDQPNARIVANSLNGQVGNVARLVGAALGGVLTAAGGTAAVGAADTVSFAAAAVLIMLIRHRSGRRAVARLRLVGGWVQGLTFVRRSRPLTVILVFMAVTGIGEAIMGTLAAPFVDDVLGGTARTYGLIMSAQAVGGIAGGVLVALVSHRFQARTLFGWGAVGLGLFDLMLFLYPLLWTDAWPALVFIGLAGLPAAAMTAGLITVLQMATDDAVRGRVFGTVTAVQNAAMLAATGLAGGAAQRFGIVAVLTVQGAGYLGAGLMVLLALMTRRSVWSNGP